jgi:sugar lactone lactonase YvrE
MGLSVDAAGDLWIADSGNNRVLKFANPWISYEWATKRYMPKTTADAVFGQPDASSNGCAAGATGLCAPFGVASDPAHSLLYIADTGNSRIVRHENPLADAIADGVIGQADFEQTACDGTGLGPDALCGPQGLALDQDGALYAADSGNNRVLLYDRGATSAMLVLGQPNMSASAPDAGAGGVSSPLGVAVDRRGNVYVADHDNNRVLEYDARVPATLVPTASSGSRTSRASRAAHPTRASAARSASPSRPSTTIPSRSPTPGTIACSSSTRRSASTTTN